MVGGNVHMTAHLHTHILLPQNIQAPLEKRPLTWEAGAAGAAPHWVVEVKTAQRVAAGRHYNGASSKASLTSSAQTSEQRSSKSASTSSGSFSAVARWRQIYLCHTGTCVGYSFGCETSASALSLVGCTISGCECVKRPKGTRWEAQSTC